MAAKHTWVGTKHGVAMLFSELYNLQLNSDMYFSSRLLRLFCLFIHHQLRCFQVMSVLSKLLLVKSTDLNVRQSFCVNLKIHCIIICQTITW